MSGVQFAAILLKIQCFICIFSANGQFINALEQSQTLFRTFSVYRFNGVGSLRVISYNVAPLAARVTWNINGNRNPASCPDKDIAMYFQLGSIPIAQFQNNNTFPPRFNIRRSYMSQVDISSNGSTHSIVFDRPVSGTWFATGFIEDKGSQIITSVNRVSCSYTLSVNISQLLVSNAVEVPIGQDMNVNVTWNGYHLFRFYLGDAAYMYTVTFDCTSSLSSSCPVTLSVRGAGLPGNNTADTAFIDCGNTATGICNLNISQPIINQWQYIQLSSYVNETIDGSRLRVDISECGKGRLNYPVITLTTVRSPIDATFASAAPLFQSVLNKTNQSAEDVSLTAENDSRFKRHISDAEKPMQQGSVLELLQMPRNVSQTDAATTISPTLSSEPLLLDIVTGWTNASMLSAAEPSYVLSGAGLPCQDKVVRLMRFNSEDNPLFTVFSAQAGSSKTVALLGNERVLLLQFNVDPFRDIGSTLLIRKELVTFRRENASEFNVSLRICVQRNRLPVDSAGDLSCVLDGQMVTLMGDDDVEQQLYPFPEPGPWFVGVQRLCYQHGIRVLCSDVAAVGLQTYLSPCVGECYNQGSCAMYSASVYTYAACHCIAGYHGFSCEDESEAASLTEQLVYTLLLTISNLCFIPAIAVAMWRRRFVELLVYFANMFFSSFYHACDMSAWSKYSLCIMPYHVLKFSDFFCSLMSFWVTLLAVARLPLTLTSVLHMAGALALSMAVKWDATNAITSAVPVATGCVIVIVSWSVHSYHKKKFFPGKRAVLWLLPGFALSIIGICIFGFLETDQNYPYTHSAWHVSISLCIIFLLPLNRIIVKEEQSADSSTVIAMSNYIDDDVTLVAANSTERP